MSEISQNSPPFPNAADALNDKQRAAIELMILGKSMSGIAAEIDVDRKTIYNWRRQETFRDELNRRRDELWSEASERLRAMVHPSLDVLAQDLVNRYDRARYRAATAVLRLVKLHPASK